MFGTLFVLYIQDTEYLARCSFCLLQCLEREMNKFIQDRIYYIYIFYMYRYTYIIHIYIYIIYIYIYTYIYIYI